MSVPDWSGEDYGRVSALQRSVATETLADLVLGGTEWVLDIGCGDGFLTRQIAARVPDGFVVGVDASPRMVTSAHGAGADSDGKAPGGPGYLRADARRLPFRRCFDVAVSFNALHWVPQLDDALGQIAVVLRPAGRAVLQMVCAGARPSVESTAMDIARSDRWAAHFRDFSAPFRHIEPAELAETANRAGLQVDELTVRDREWDFGSREQFEAWCVVGSTAWTDRLPEPDRAAFVDELVSTYQVTAGRPGLFRFMQMRAELHP
mgnify:FL=1